MAERIWNENDNLNWNEINRYRAMPSEELDELIKKGEEFIKKEIAEARARKQ